MHPPTVEDSERTLAYIHFATATFCAYEYSLTLGEEVKYIWNRKLSMVSLLFVLSRYGVICYNVLSIITLVPWSQAFYQYRGGTDGQMSVKTVTPIPRSRNDNAYLHSCKTGAILAHIMSAVIYSAMALFAALRTYALWNRDYRVLLCVLITGLGYPVGYIYFITRVQEWNYGFQIDQSYIGCGRYNTFAPHTLTFKLRAENIFHIIGVSLMLLFEVVTITLTWIRTFPDVRRLKCNQTSNIASYLSYIILHDGTIHFIAMVLTMALGLLGMVYKPFIHSIIFTQSLASVLMSRFILDLRRARDISEYGGQGFDYSTNTYDFDSSFDISSIKFVANTSLNSASTQ